jgi:glutamate racemase
LNPARGIAPAPLIGVFDSGVGGLSVVEPLRELVPAVDVIYAGDAAWCPYGPRPVGVIRERAEAIARILLARGVALVVVACNTASTAALAHLRRQFPEVPFVGMEPAVKPAAAQTETGSIGVLATATTAKGEALARLVDRYGRGVAVHVAVPEGLVELVEEGLGDSPAAEALLRPILGEFAAQRVDAVVLGCTHYPFARGAIERLAGPGVRVIDPAPAVARQAVRVLGREGEEIVFGTSSQALSGLRPGPAGARPQTTTGRQGTIRFLTSGEPGALREAVERVMPPGWTAGAAFGPLGA